MVLPISELHTNEILQYLFFCFWLPLFNTIVWSDIYIVLVGLVWFFSVTPYFFLYTAIFSIPLFLGIWDILRFWLFKTHCYSYFCMAFDGMELWDHTVCVNSTSGCSVSLFSVVAPVPRLSKVWRVPAPSPTFGSCFCFALFFVCLFICFF